MPTFADHNYLAHRLWRVTFPVGFSHLLNEFGQPVIEAVRVHAGQRNIKRLNFDHIVVFINFANVYDLNLNGPYALSLFKNTSSPLGFVVCVFRYSSLAAYFFFIRSFRQPKPWCLLRHVNEENVKWARRLWTQPKIDLNVIAFLTKMKSVFTWDCWPKTMLLALYVNKQQLFLQALASFCVNMADCANAQQHSKVTLRIKQFFLFYS